MSVDTSKLVISALAKTLSIEHSEKIHMNDKLKEDLGLDSMSSLTFLMALEETIDGFFVDPDTLDMDYLNSVATITDYVNKQIKLKQ